ncbi:unnamed protein product, partial [Symbiodinium microadriaticum]
MCAFFQGALDAVDSTHGFQRLPDVRTVKPREPDIDIDDVPAILNIKALQPEASNTSSAQFPFGIDGICAGEPFEHLSEEFQKLLDQLVQQHMREVSRAELEVEALRREAMERAKDPCDPCEVGSAVTVRTIGSKGSNRGSPVLQPGSKGKRRTSQAGHGPSLHASELLGVWDAKEEDETDLEKFFKGKSRSDVSSKLLRKETDSEESKSESVLAAEYQRFLIGVSEAPMVPTEAMPAWDQVFLIGDMTFAAVFALDVCVRILILRLQFWTVWMNYIDVAVSATSVIEISLSNILRLPVSPVLFRLLRIGKLARAIRMVTM